jgi:hypothetical protein
MFTGKPLPANGAMVCPKVNAPQKMKAIEAWRTAFSMATPEQ